MEIIAKINDGELVYDSSRLDQFLKKNEGKTIVCNFETVKDVKSYEQLKFYFGVLLPAFVQATGETSKDKLDAYLRDKYLSSVHVVNGEHFKYIPTLQIGKNKVTKEKMSWYIEQCLNELIDCGGSIPLHIVEEYHAVMLSDIES